MKATVQLKARAIREQKAIFAAEVSGKHLPKGEDITGGMAFVGAIEQNLGMCLWMFCHRVYSGKSPREAFDETPWADATCPPCVGSATGGQPK